MSSSEERSNWPMFAAVALLVAGLAIAMRLYDAASVPKHYPLTDEWVTDHGDHIRVIEEGGVNTIYRNSEMVRHGMVIRKQQ